MKKLLLLTFLSPLVCFGATTFPSGGGGTVSSNSIRSLGFLQTNGVGTGLTGLPGGGDALVANPLSQFAATTSAQFFGVISDEDGNGPVLAAKDNTQTNVTIMDGLIVTNKATGQFMQISNGVATLGGGSGPGLAIFLEGTAPSNPSSGSQALYVDSTSHQVSAKPSGGTVSVMVTPDTGASHNFLTAISSAGVISKAQPAFTDISGSVAAAQVPALTGAVTSSAGSTTTSLGSFSSANLSGALTDETGSNLAVFNTDPLLKFSTNSGSTVKADFSLRYTLLSTNAAFTFLAPANVDSGNTLVQATVTFVTNTTAAAVAITLPANVHGVGTQYVTNLTRIDWEVYGGNKFTNAFFLPIF